MAELTYIPIDKLWPHPDNPRKDLGDVSELADSIKANGVLQNLTVVKRYGDITGDFDGHYTVIIGHRRLAAAKLAGLKELPCVVAEMTTREQLQTMLMENMQRADLTVYEQAQGFQMMLDLGATVDEIAAESGFSASTVRRRVKLLALDQEKFKASESRGATLQDYIELDKIHDPELKNKALDAIGTANFQNELRKAQEEEKRREFVKDRVADVSQWATEVGDMALQALSYVKGYSWWSWGKHSVVERPADAETRSYYYKVDHDGVTIYVLKEAKQEAETDEDRKRREMHEKDVQVGEMLDEIEKRHESMRKAFVKDFWQVGTHQTEICQFACAALNGFSGYYRGADPDIIAEMLDDVEVDENASEQEFIEQVAASSHHPMYKLLASAYSVYEGGNTCCYTHEWNSGTSTWFYTPRENENLHALYAFLTSIGYEVSDEEKALLDGTHELFFNGENV